LCKEFQANRGSIGRFIKNMDAWLSNPERNPEAEDYSKLKDKVQLHLDNNILSNE
jgi:hypothetical protein